VLAKPEGLPRPAMAESVAAVAGRKLVEAVPVVGVGGVDDPMRVRLGLIRTWL